MLIELETDELLEEMELGIEAIFDTLISETALPKVMEKVQKLEKTVEDLQGQVESLALSYNDLDRTTFKNNGVYKLQLVKVGQEETNE